MISNVSSEWELKAECGFKAHSALNLEHSDDWMSSDSELRLKV